MHPGRSRWPLLSKWPSPGTAYRVVREVCLGNSRACIRWPEASCWDPLRLSSGTIWLEASAVGEWIAVPFQVKPNSRLQPTAGWASAAPTPTACPAAADAQTLGRLDNWARYSYTIARMKYNIILSPGAVREFRAASAFERGQVQAAIERHLRHEPARLSRSRIKRLRGLRRPQYRLRIGDIRVFYDVIDDQVQILTILGKAQVEAWLKEKGTPNEEDRSR